MHLILTGATGLVGTAVLSHILSLPHGQIDKLTILSRKPVPLAEDHPITEVIIHHNFGTYPEDLLQKLKGADGVIWGQGISQSEVDREEYIKITRDWPIAAAKAFSKLPVDGTIKFVYVSGEGATTDPGLFTPLFGRIKGQAEAELLKLSKNNPLLRAYSLRPGFVDAVAHPEIQPIIGKRERPFSYRAMETVLAPAFRKLQQGQVSPTKELGKVLTELAMSDGAPLKGEGIEGEGRTIRNSAMRRMAGLP